MDILEKLFGTTAKVKIMRLFLFNPEYVFSLDEIIERGKMTGKEVKNELPDLIKTGLIRKKPFIKDVIVVKKKKTVTKRIKGIGYLLDGKFPYLNALKTLLISVSLHSHDDIARRFSKVGKIKALIVAGVFIQDWESRVDLMIVGDELDNERIHSIVKLLESELGKEISYTALDTADFEYRIGVYDKLVRDILDFPHVKIVDRLSLS
ncbi:MAG: hypothetical protein KBD47_01035 [Candidatus Pacebacteria bacterium]|jgi:hypothetical protein|nr:hypothetical protein [Candidatus Paceibacterota bacterium]